ncbi:YIP1 family protein [Pseudoprimorskyibacter insulae]|uniref:Yip1 domain-containing protein n=1 Tax=Pseudoprimorskyibacter insulae TaxID=1695997 RepID=A0A2R8AXI6_9RHOB|nr:YIP1 family protein [Pseudoprimorskyibacter insulae]SPF80667.1 hypothetical protein PRI8871_02478 [Pseudoprimorskyibacter insulae]
MTLPMQARVIQSVQAPRAVADWLIRLQLPRNTVLLAFALVVVLNTLLTGITLLGDPMAALAGPLAAPWVMAVVFALMVLIFAACIASIGRMMGGQGRFDQILLMLTWMQALRILVQIAVLIVAFISPGLALIGAFVASLLGIWIFLNLVDVVHAFGSLLKTLGVVFLGFIGMAVALMVVVPMIGIQ